MMVAVGKPSSRPRWSPSTTVPSTMNGAPRQCLAPSMSPAAIRARIRVEETASPSTSTSGTTRVSNSGGASSISGAPWALAPQRKVSPTETRAEPRRAPGARGDPAPPPRRGRAGGEPLDQDLADEVLGADLGELLVEGDH